MNGNGMIGLDGTPKRAGSNSERVKRTQLVETSGSGVEVMPRSKSLRSAYGRKRSIKRVSMLVIFAAAVIIVSAIALAAFGNNAPKTHLPAQQMGPPPLPFYIFGYLTDSGTNPVPFAFVNVSRPATGNFSITQADNVGFYSFDISLWVPIYAPGDVIDVVANTTTLVGSNSGTIGGTPYLQLDMVMTTGSIPEFTTIVIPIVGMFTILAVARVAMSRSDEEDL